MAQIHCTPEGCQLCATSSICFKPTVIPSTYTSLLYHVIFSTKGREPIIAAAWRGQLHEYLGGTVRGLGGVSLGVGGVTDHVHLLVSLKATQCLADFMRELKKASSIWVSDSTLVRGFRWQEGYAALTVSASGREDVQQYIARQEEHHRRRTFKEELIEILTKSGVIFDEKYLD
jgi:REP element-mobilizing transposase RayT